MHRKYWIHRVKTWGLTVTVALLVVACASIELPEPMQMPEPEPVRVPGMGGTGESLPEPPPSVTPDSSRVPAPSAPTDSNMAGDQLEEITVTGAAAASPDRERRTNETWHEMRRHGKNLPQSADEQSEDADRLSNNDRRFAEAREMQRLLEEAKEREQARLAMTGDARPTLARANPDEEIWIIAQEASYDDPSSVDDGPGSGAMVALIPQDDKSTIEIALPLKHTAVNASIDGYISTVDVRQSFENPYSQKIEVTYMFPLPEKSAVNEFVMIIGERKIRGILRKKAEAEALYYEARRQGYQASLLVQHRPNVFEQKVANIEPGKAIDVEIRYFNTLTYTDGWYSFVFPTVVGPRFNPPGSKDPIEALPRGGETSTPNTSQTYLRPNERSGHDISIAVDINAGVTIDSLRSTHQIIANRPSEERASVELATVSAIPNRDFVLEFKVAGDTIRSNLLTWTNPGDGQGYFTMMMYPPAELGSLERRPMEMVFVLDCSGSMRGRPLQQAKDAVSAALTMLQPDDTFQIIRFSEAATQLGPQPLPATPANIAIARNYLQQLSGTGGTMMIEGIKAALDFPHDERRLRFVSFMTDGYIGNEAQIIGEINKRVGASRIFSFGVGSSVNRYLMERMAKVGRGAVAYLGPQDSGTNIMSAFFERVSHPAMTDLAVNWGSMQVSDVYPSKAPDMFVGRPVFVTGKFSGTPSAVTVSGLAGNETQQFQIAHSGSGNPNLSKLWARLRIADLKDRQSWEHDPYNELASSIEKTALDYQLMSDYTAFVAVDASYRTAGAEGTTVKQAVPVPDGVPYETSVSQ